MEGHLARLWSMGLDLIGDEKVTKKSLNHWVRESSLTIVGHALEYCIQKRNRGVEIRSPRAFIDNAVQLRLKPEGVAEKKPPTKRSIDEAKAAERRATMERRRRDVLVPVKWSEEQIRINEAGLSSIKDRLGGSHDHL